jgi:hypothetical protein
MDAELLLSLSAYRRIFSHAATYLTTIDEHNPGRLGKRLL